MDNAEPTPESRGALRLDPSCDVCGQVVHADDFYTAELTVSGAMCPSPMTFHTACYEAAASMWHPDPDSYCTVDPLFPETANWNRPTPKVGEDHS